MNQVWPLRIGRFVYGLLLAMCGLAFGTLSNSIGAIFLAAMLGAMIGIYVGDKIVTEGKDAYKNVVRGTLVGLIFGLAVVWWQDWPWSAWIIVPAVCALCGGFIGTNVRGAMSTSAQFAILGVGAGLLFGILYWLVLIFHVGLSGDTLALGFERLVRSVLSFAFLAGFTGALVGAVWRWQCLRPQRKIR